MTLRLLAFFQHMPPYPGAGALRGQAIASGLAAVQHSAGWAGVCVFTTTPQPDVVPGVQIVTLNAPEIESSRSLTARVVGELRIGRAAAREMLDRQQCELVVISSPGYLAALVIAARARRLGIPYVLDLRDIYPQVYAEAGLLRRGSLPYRFFAERSRRLYEGAEVIIAATRGLAREVLRDVPRARVECVYNGFPAALLERAARKHERFTACFHGTLGFFQDVDTLVEVARQVRPHDVDVVVIGYGRKEEPLRAANLDNLRFLGRLGFAETIAEVERCHVGLCLRMNDQVSKDAFPVKVWEYLGLGMPSLVTPPCEAGEFLVEHGCGLEFPAGAARAIVDAVLRLRDDADERRAIERRCREVAARFTRERLGLDAAEVVAALRAG
jgi:glycosyltransferase involved in cell wall biosynthesis